jgi:hypothetical protein
MSHVVSRKILSVEINSFGNLCVNVSAVCWLAAGIDHLGGGPRVLQRMLIDWIVKSRMQIDLLDEKLAQGSFTPDDQGVYNALHNALRLTARELGLKSALPAATTSKPQARAQSTISQVNASWSPQASE